MGSNYQLTPSPSGDPYFHLLQRLADLEGRMSRIERARDLVVTPFSLTVPNTLVYDWAGGRMWAMLSGYILLNNASGVAGYDFKANGTLVTGTSQGSDAGSTGSHLQTLYTEVREIDQAYLAASTTFSFTVASGSANYSQIQANGMLVEWPYQ
jgi:hypothetical protein